MKTNLNPRSSGRVQWQSPANIALVKYWGKYPGQIPANPSLSLTLRHSVTEMEIEYVLQPKAGLNLEFYFNGQANSLFKEKIEKFLQSLTDKFHFLTGCMLTIHSRNSFPHSTGIASSASSMSALALCLSSIEQETTGIDLSPESFLQRTSQIARLGSGSACRSLYGPFCLWGEVSGLESSSNDYAIACNEVSPYFQTLHDSILIVSTAAKSVSSRAGHELMQTHPFAEARFSQAKKHLQELLILLKGEDFSSFAEIVELEAMTLHSLMLSSRPTFTLLKPESLALIKKIQMARTQSGLPVCFTIDAGPNIHLLYPQARETEVKTWIDQELRKYCESGSVIHDQWGLGPTYVS